MKEVNIFTKTVQRGINVAKFLANCLKIELSLLLRPKKAFAEILIASDSALTNATCFLLLNTILAHMIAKRLGFEMGNLQSNPPFFSLLGLSELLLPVIPYALGIAVFAVSFRYIAKSIGIHILFSKIFSIACYASCIFIPIVIVKFFCSRMTLAAIGNTILSVWNEMPINFGFVTCTKVALWLILPLFFYIWWLSYIYRGIKIVGLTGKKIKKIVIFAFLVFFVTKIIVDSTYFLVSRTPDIKAIKIFLAGDIKKVLSITPTDYFKASSLAHKVANCEQFSPYIRYSATIEGVTYMMAGPHLSPDDESKRITMEALDSISRQNYKEAQEILMSYLQNQLSDIANGQKDSVVEFEKDYLAGFTLVSRISSKKAFYTLLMEDLEKAEQLRNSAEYTDEEKTLWFTYARPLKLSYSPMVLFP